METPNYNTDIIDNDIYFPNWNDIENTEADFDSYLNEIENFFREDCEENNFEEYF